MKRTRRSALFGFLSLFLTFLFGAILPVTAAPEAAGSAQASAPGIEALAFSPSGTNLATGTSDSQLQLWDAVTGDQVRAFAGHAGGPITGVAFSPDGRTLVSAGKDSVIRVWDVATGAQILSFGGHEQPIRALAISPDGKTLATGGDDSRVFIWDLRSGRLVGALDGHKDFILTLAFSPDGKTIASASQDDMIILWNTAALRERKVLRGHAAAVLSVAFSPDGTTLASASADTTLRLWDVSAGEQRKRVDNGGKGVRSVGFSPSGAELVSGGDDLAVTVRDRKAEKERLKLRGNQGRIRKALFSPNGQTIASADESGEILVWESATGKLKTRIKVKARTKKLTSAAVDTAATRDLAAASTNPLVAQATQAALTDGPGGPILVITTGANKYSHYYAEILRAEGLNSFAVADISTVTAATLAGYDLAILADMPLSGTQATMFSDWVNGGGNLIAMRPDADLAGLLGLTATGATLSEGFLLVDTSQSPGNGIVAETIQFHGTADRYTLSGATSVATLYTSATAATTSPAISRRSVGSGQAAAFAYDLARSVVYTRQGNPAWAAQERDGFTPMRPDDLFFGAAPANPQADWVDLTKVLIPQADEQQRLLANLILDMNQARRPLPRFWYFPFGEQAVVLMTGDDHAQGGTAGRFERFLELSPAGCNVDRWECIRGTSYIYPNSQLTTSQATNYNAQGFEVALHVNTDCQDFTSASLNLNFTTQLNAFSANYSGVPAPVTQRTHCVVWSDWSSKLQSELTNNIRLDTTYYYWPPSWVLDRPGFFTGSGIPMRFADTDGTMFDIYQAPTQMTDESAQSYPYTINTLLDKALGPEGYYGIFTVNAHTDYVYSSVAEAVVSAAMARGVPVVSARQVLTWLDARNSSSFSAIAWSGNVLSFNVTADAAATGLQAMIPVNTSAGTLAALSRGGSPVAFTTRAVKGISYAFFDAASGSYTATFTSDTVAPTVQQTTPAAGSAGNGLSTAVTATFSEPIDAATVNSTTFELRDAANTPVPATVSYNSATQTASLAPISPLANGATYTALLRGGPAEPRIKDPAGNSLANNVTWSFTTLTAPQCPCSIWSSSTVPPTPFAFDPNSVELGVKFRSSQPGFITGIRYYKDTQNSGTHVGNLWSSSGQLLARATFTNESASGWQQVNFGTPVQIQANTTYIASYHTSSQGYAYNPDFFSAQAVSNGPLTALAAGTDGSNGVYIYAGTSTFPTETWRSSNYWVDVVFDTSGTPPPPPTDTTPPTVTTTAPAPNAVDVAVGASITATFSEELDPATVNDQTFELRTGGTAVPATVTYNVAGRTATLTPNSALVAGTAYTASLRGGTSDPRIKDLAGNALANPYSWSFTTASGSTGACANPPNAIVAENCLPGNPASEWEVQGAGDLSIQGFATAMSINRGQTVSFKIKTDAGAYRIDIYRIGFYGGDGARKVATVLPSANLPQSQPSCLFFSATKTTDCGNWDISASWPVPADATSGIYIARLVRTDTGGASHIPFVVRHDGSTSDLLFQTSDTTWQAYNNYGGYSLYGSPNAEFDSPNRAYKVSYNRPMVARSMERGISYLFNAEYPMVRWLERNGYDVSYFSGIDTDRYGSQLLNHKAFLSVGHDEYWSGPQRANVEAARNGGTNLAFFSGNDIFWKIRWENSLDGSNTAYRTLVCYKETKDGAKIDPSPEWTGTWRDPRFSPPSDGGRPENALTGSLYMINGPRVPADALEVPAEDGKMRFWRNSSVASLAPGQKATFAPGTLGYEWNVDADNGFRPAGLVRMSSTTVNIGGEYLLDYGDTYGAGVATHHLTLYKHASGARVFSAGSVQWSWGLDANHDAPYYPAPAADVRMQQATVNLLADMSIQPATLQSELVAATASTDAAAPSSTITAPTTGSNAQAGAPLTVNGNAVDTGGGVVGGVEISVDGGATWHPASGRGSWSYTWTPQANGNLTIKSRATDDSGNIEAPGSGVTITVGTTDTTPPTVTARTPTTGATGVSIATNATATFNEALDPATVSGATVELRDAASSLVTATATYNAASRTVTIDPSADLAPNTAYTVTIKGGATDPRIKDLAGNALATNTVWSFTTGNGACPCSLWDNATVPGVITEPDPQAVELGVKLRSDRDGEITAIRFYKGPQNTGAHTVKLWTSTGTLLASAPSTSESASGWQEVNLPTPVSITAGVVYIASYHTTSGYYSEDRNFFASAGLSSGPLYALRDGENGPNGVYSYGAGGFPTSTFQSANYWVDVVFVPTPVTPPPAAPTGLTATAGDAQVALNWSASSGATSYTVKQATSSGGPFTIVASGLTTSSYTASGLTNSTTYYFVVSASNAGGESSNSSPVSATPSPPPTDTTNLLANPGFELDANADSGPDTWSSDSRFTRDTALSRSGTYAGRHTATNNSSYTVFQRVPVTAGKAYAFDSWVNIPATADTFTFRLELRWLNATNGTISTSTVRSFTAATSGWSQAANNRLITPAGAVTAEVRMVVSSLNATVYVDDLALRPANFLLNGGFELDTNADNRPDSWTSNSKFTRSNAAAYTGTYAGRHVATDNRNHTIGQTVTGLIAGTSYQLSGRVNIPTTSDVFSLVVDVEWRNAANAVLGTTAIKSYNAPTDGWDLAQADLVAPAGATRAVIRMVVTNLNATIYVDEFDFE